VSFRSSTSPAWSPDSYRAVAMVTWLSAWISDSPSRPAIAAAMPAAAIAGSDS
jgi:hypothetical protein